ncbi:MAG: lysoplasmalogenase [Flavihumibacter sp.]
MRWPGWLIGYLACVLLHLLSLLFGWEWIRYASKPLLMLILLFAGSRPWVNAALFFSWLGDIFLLGAGDRYFMAGLASFLLAHICYIVFFYRRRRQLAEKPRWNLYGIIGMSLYTGTFYFFLAPYLNNALRPPVFVYAVTIAVMFVFSWLMNRYCILGAAFFLVSDSLLAVNSFIRPLAAAPFFIMATYAAAQLLIVWGCRPQNNTYVTN